jgi:hypothetical protein
MASAFSTTPGRDLMHASSLEAFDPQIASHQTSDLVSTSPLSEPSHLIESADLDNLLCNDLIGRSTAARSYEEEHGIITSAIGASIGQSAANVAPTQSIVATAIMPGIRNASTSWRSAGSACMMNIGASRLAKPRIGRNI